MGRLPLYAATLLAATPALLWALDMSQDQYVDYSAQLHCLNQQYWDQPDKLEQALIKLEDKFDIGEQDFNALDALTAQYNGNSAVQSAIEARIHSLCP